MGNTGQALSNLTQPYLASAIGTYFDKLEEDPVTHQIVHQADTTAERLLAHAAAGAVVAYFSGNNATSGATGAVSGEAMAIIVHDQLYGNKPTDQLTTAEKENIRAVATLAAGLAGALQGGSFETAATSAAAGYNAAVNNDVGLDEVKDGFGAVVGALYGTIEQGMNSADGAAKSVLRKTGTVVGVTMDSVDAIRNVKSGNYRDAAGNIGSGVGGIVGGAVGGLLGIETGPGAVLTGVAGGYAGGKAGEQTAKWVFDGVKWVRQKIR